MGQALNTFVSLMLLLSCMHISRLCFGEGLSSLDVDVQWKLEA
jgi:hypothetical protein